MTSRIVCLGLALAGLGWVSLGVVRTPTWLSWKLGLVAGEFGHWLALLMLLVAIGAYLLASSGGGAGRIIASVALATAMVAMALGLRPATLAAGIARNLPAEMQRGFGGEPTGEAFSWAKLWSVRGVAPVKVETRVYAGAGTADELGLDVYRAVEDTPRPLVVVIHGGGWDSGDRQQLTDFNHQVARMGYVVAAISYHLAPAHVWPAQKKDALAAIAYLKTHAAELGIDPSRIVLLGRSAGGQIASAVGYGVGDPAIRGVVGLYSPHDLNFAWRYAREDDALNSVKLMRQYMGGTGEERREAYNEASGIRFVKRREATDPRPTPPTLLMHGTIDTLVWRRQSERLTTVLAVNDVPHVFVELPWAVHAFDFNPHGPGGQLLDYALRNFLRTVTAPGPLGDTATR